MQSKRGFSLLETLLYIGIFAIIGGSLFGILTNVVRVSTREISGGEVASQLQFAMETINRLVRESSNIDTATSTATTTMKLRMTDPLLDPTCVTLTNGVLKLAQGPDQYDPELCTATTTDITTNKVVVDSALFKKIEFPGGKDQLSIDLQFSNTATGQNKISRALRAGVSRASAATFDSDLLPNNDATYEVGFSGTKRWKNISLSNLLNLGVISSDPSGIDGSIYYNSTSKKFRGKANGAWADLGSSLWMATSTHMYSNVTGNVGIGTNDPQRKLHVNGEIALGEGVADSGNLRIVGNTNHWNIDNFSGRLRFFTEPNYSGGGNEWMTITSTGNVGIGTANPSQQLEVTKNILLPSAVLETNGNLFLGGDTSAGVNGLRMFSLDSAGGAFFDAKTSDNTKGFIFRTDTSNGATERMRITSGGNVGIGVGTPGAKLEVNGMIKAGGNYYNIISYNFNGTPISGMKIKTNLPYVNGSQMPVVIIEGFSYGNSQPIGLSIVWYIYNGNFTNYSVTSWGAYRPAVRLANEGGKVVIYLDDRPYYARYTVRAYAQGMAETPDMFNGWTIADEAYGGTNQVTVPYTNGVIDVSYTVDMTSLAANTTRTYWVAATGAVVNDFCMWAGQIDQRLVIDCQINSSGQASLNVRNVNAFAIDPPSTTFYLRIQKR